MKWRVDGCAMMAMSRQGAATSSGLVTSRSAWYDSLSGPRRLKMTQPAQGAAKRGRALSARELRAGGSPAAGAAG